MDDRRRRDDEEDEAVFAPARITGRRRPPIFLAGVALAIGALVGAGTLDGSGAARSVPPAAGPGLTARVAIQTEAPGPTRTSRPPGPRNLTGQRDLIALDLRQLGRHLFVHGDVFSLDAFIVVVSLDVQGTVTRTRTVSMPGGSTAFLTGANPRFDVRFDMPGEAPEGSIWVRANAYDTHGDPILSLREPVFARTGLDPRSARHVGSGLPGAPARGAPARGAPARGAP